MTFLNPLALFGLFAAAIPVLLHILTLRRLRTIEFSTLRFLKELQRTRIRRLKLRQLLLLILRTLLVVLVVLAFSRPTLRGSLGTGAGARARTTAVLILDDTPSMTAAGDRGELFTQATVAASQVLDLLEDGDDAALVRVSEAAAADVPVPVRSIPFLRNTLKDVRPTMLTRTTEAALRTAARVLAPSKNFNKEVYLLSDLQAGTLESSPAAPAEHLFDARMRLFLLPLEAGTIRNASVEEVRLPDAVRDVGRPVTVQVRVANHGTQALSNHVVSLFIEGSRVAQRGIELPAGGNAVAAFEFTPAKAGILTGLAEVEDDDLEFDNHRAFTVSIPAELHVLVAGTPADIPYVRLALETRLSDTVQSIRVDAELPERLTSSLLSRQDAVVLVNPGLLPTGAAQSLADFVRQGGGLMLFPGPRTQPQSYQASFGAMGLPPMAGVDRVSSGSGGAAAFISLDHVDWEHPLFHQLFEDRSQGHPGAARAGSSTRTLESPEIRTAARFVPGPKTSVLVTQTNGAPFLLEEPVGRGRVLVLSVSASREWSDLPVRGIFVPLLHRGAMYAARQREDHPPMTVGEPVSLILRDIPRSRLTVTDPAGGETPVVPVPSGTERSVQLPETSRPGIYRVRSDGTTIDAVALNVDPRESDTAPAERARLRRLFARLGLEESAVVPLTPGSGIARAVDEARFGTELWRHALAAALLIALVEMAVARDTKRATQDFADLARERNA